MSEFAGTATYYSRFRPSIPSAVANRLLAEANREAARSLFGNRLEEFESSVRMVLSEYSNDDTFHEENEFTICLGRRNH